MTIQFLRTGTPATQVSIADRPELTLPNGDWALGWLMTATDTTSSGYQLLARTGNSSEAGGLCIIYDPATSGTGWAGKIYVQVNGATGTNRCITPIALEQGKSYIYVLQRVGGLLYSKLCPVFNVAPSDPAAVHTSATLATSLAYDGAQGLILGVHNVANRRSGMAMGRVFLINESLTDAEIAELALGKEITEFAAPLVYLRMNDQSDIADTGTLQNAVTVTGSFVAGPDPGFGYSSTPSAPVFNGVPVINGSAVVGEPVAFTAATATGNPVPTMGYQWTINGADIAGATGTTYTPAASDAGKQLRVRQTATNSQGSTSATSDPALVSSTATGLTETVQQAAANNERIYQRINGVAAVAVGGAYTGAIPAKIEYQLYAPNGVDVVHPWADTGATIGGGNWSASPLMPQATDGKKYLPRFRSVDAGGNPIFTTAVMPNRFGVGDIIAVLGSSSPATWFGSGSGSNRTPDHNVVSTMLNEAWALFDTYGQASLMAAYFASKSGVPTALYNTALGGSTLASWADTNSSLWTTFLSRLAAAGGKLAGVFGSAGSNDITGASAAQTVEAHLAKLRAVAVNTRAATGQPALPILWSGINRRYDALVLQANNARAAEREFGEDENVYYVQTLDIEVGDPESTTDKGDGVHPTGTGYATCCRRIEYVWTEGVFYGRRQRGPVIKSIAYSGPKATITIEHRNTGAADLTARSRATTGTPSAVVPMSSATGFKVIDDNGTPAITLIERADGTRITLTCDRNLVNPKITYMEGAWVDNAAPVFDDAPTALPMMADPIGLAGAGAVYSTVSQTMNLSYAIAAATGSAPTYKTVSQTLDLSYNIAAASVPDPQYFTVSRTLSLAWDIAAAQEQSTEAFVASKERTIQVQATDRAMSTTGKFWNVTNPKQPKGIKDPNETLDFSFDWSPWLTDATDSILSYSFTFSGGLVKAGEGKTGEMPTVFVSGGEIGTASITCRIVTKSTPARTADRTVYLTIEER